MTGLVLAGGRSRRMGRDKALLPVVAGDGTWLERAMTVLEPHVSRGLVACGARERYGALVRRRPGWSLVLDDRDGEGPLAGIVAGLEAARTERILVLAVDMPGVDADAVGVLVGAARPGDQVLHVRDPRGPQPLFALLARDVLPAARAALRAGERRAVAYWDDVRTRAVDPSLAGDGLRNVNTPLELAAEEEGA